MKHYSYRVIIEPDEKGAFHAFVPALPGCHTWGASLEKARSNIRDAIDVYIRSLKRDGEPIPEERGVETVETVKVGPAPRSA